MGKLHAWEGGGGGGCMTRETVIGVDAQRNSCSLYDAQYTCFMQSSFSFFFFLITNHVGIRIHFIHNIISLSKCLGGFSL